MPEFRAIYLELDKIIRNNYEKLGLECLSDRKFNNKHPLTYFGNMLDNKQPIHNYHQLKFFSELSFISDDLKYYTALLFLLKPFINNPIRDNKTYFQTTEDKRYLSIASILFQIFYNYWDRLGDLLYIFLETNLKEKDVFFPSVLNNLIADIKTSTTFKDLKDLYDTHISTLFNKRKKIVHYFQVTSETYINTFINYDSEDFLSSAQKEKEEYPEYFKINIEFTFVGFELVLKLIAEFGIDKES